jgi:hypothetical protein
VGTFIDVTNCPIHAKSAPRPVAQVPVALVEFTLTSMCAEDVVRDASEKILLRPRRLQLL